MRIKTGRLEVVSFRCTKEEKDKIGIVAKKMNISLARFAEKATMQLIEEIK